MVLIIAFIVSLIPAVFLYLWMRNKIRDDPQYKNNCRKALIRGLLTCIPVFLCSMILNIVMNVIFKDRDSLLYIVLYNFLVLALSEEACKMFMMLKLKKDSEYQWSWLETMIFMTCVGIGFELLESGVYGLITNAIQMLVRGVTMMHAVFGMIMGYYWGKAEYTGNRIYYVLSFAVPWLFHGLYDLSLKETIIDINDFFLFLPFILVAINMIVLIRSIKFIRKNKDNPMYMSVKGSGSENEETMTV